eukprot:jgi/Tetstr1/439364/TSEL_027799.t1
MNRPYVTLSAKRRTYVMDEPEVVAHWAASLRSRLQDAFGSNEMGQWNLDLLSRSLTAQTLKGYAGRLSRFAESCHDLENVSPLEATTAIVGRSAGAGPGTSPGPGSDEVEIYGRWGSRPHRRRG